MNSVYSLWTTGACNHQTGDTRRRCSNGGKADRGISVYTRTSDDDRAAGDTDEKSLYTADEMIKPET